MQRRCRTTQQRKVILEELCSVATHPTADELCAKTRVRLPRISLGTVYRNLDHLARQGKIARLEHAGAQRRFDGNVEPHCHVRCRACGCIGDVAAGGSLPSVAGVKAEGFIVTGVRLEFDGICSSCSAAGDESVYVVTLP